MTPQTDRQAFHFPDGSEVEFTVRTNESAIARIFTTDLAKRMRRVQLVVTDTDASLAAFKSSVPESRTDDRRSTTTHTLPEGEVTVSIDASGKGIHGYLYHLVTAAVAYTHAVDLEFEKATLFAASFLASALALVWLGQGILSVPLFGAGGTIVLHLVVYWLSASGLPMSLSRAPKPAGSNVRR